MKTQTPTQLHRERLRARGLRPVQIIAPDTRDPAFAAEYQRQCRDIMAADATSSGADRRELEALNAFSAAAAGLDGWE